MKILPAFLFVILMATAGSGFSQNLLPQDKEIEILDEGERNPFGRRGPDPSRVVIEDTETEESRLQTENGRMEVSGFAEGPYGRSVLLGRQKIFPGDTLPSLLPRQTEVLRVHEIHTDRIELIFVEKQARATPRTITIRYNLDPKVRHLLATQVPLNREPAVEMLGQFPPAQNQSSEVEDGLSTSDPATDSPD